MEFKIAVLPGDGIGPEVIEQGIKVLNAISERFGHAFQFSYADVGATAIDKTGNPLPEETLDACIQSDAVLFGAIGHPKYDNDPSAKVRPEQGLLGLRKSLGLFCNIRPVTIFRNLVHLSPVKNEYLNDVDFVIYRELIGGIYFGEKGRSEDGHSAYDTCTYNKSEIIRIGKLAFDHASRRKKKLTLVDKANVLETSRLWRETIQQLAWEYPDVAVNYLFIDNAAMQMILNPVQFDVILTENMFGDILSDESSVLAGSLGLVPSASLGEKTSMFEPIHGSYPQATGKDIANPIGTVLSVAMMLDFLKLNQEANTIIKAVTRLLKAGIGTPDLKVKNTYTCSKVGDVLEALIVDKDQKMNYKKFEEGSSTII